MINWNTDVEAAKTAGWILICIDNEKRWVGLSCWLEDEQRWNMIATNQTPYGWAEINHPLSETPFVKPMGINTESPPPLKAHQPAPEAFTNRVKLPTGVKVSLPPGLRL